MKKPYFGEEVTRDALFAFAEAKLIYCADKRAAAELEKHDPYFLTCNERRFLEEYNTPEAAEERAALVKEVNRYTEEVINQDEHYYRKLSSYDFDSDILAFCM